MGRGSLERLRGDFVRLTRSRAHQLEDDRALQCFLVPAPREWLRDLGKLKYPLGASGSRLQNRDAGDSTTW